MALYTNSEKPEWLTDDEVKKMKVYISECSNPYTKEELENISLDGDIDVLRWRAYEAKRILTEYGLL